MFIIWKISISVMLIVLNGQVDSVPYWARPDSSESTQGGWLPLQSSKPTSQDSYNILPPSTILTKTISSPEFPSSKQIYGTEETRPTFSFLPNIEPLQQSFLQRQEPSQQLFPPYIKQNFQSSRQSFNNPLLQMTPYILTQPDFNYSPHQNPLIRDGSVGAENSNRFLNTQQSNIEQQSDKATYNTNPLISPNFISETPSLKNTSEKENPEKEEIQILYVPIEMLRQRQYQYKTEDKVPTSTRHVSQLSPDNNPPEEPIQTSEGSKKFRHPIQPLSEQLSLNRVRHYSNSPDHYRNQNTFNITNLNAFSQTIPLQTDLSLKYTEEGTNFRDTASPNREQSYDESNVQREVSSFSGQTEKRTPLENKPYETRDEPLEFSTIPPPNQPPLSVYLESSYRKKVANILDLLKDTKTIPVIDSLNPNIPHIFVGPSNLETPQGYVKFELPYLSSLNNKVTGAKLSEVPFFVAPLNFEPPAGFSKIPFPPPHIGSVILANTTNEEERISSEGDSLTKDYRDSLTIPAEISSISPQLPSLINSLQEEEYALTTLSTEAVKSDIQTTTDPTTVSLRRPYNSRNKNYRGSTHFSSVTRRPPSRERKPSHRHFNQKQHQQSDVKSNNQYTVPSYYVESASSKQSEEEKNPEKETSDNPSFYPKSVKNRISFYNVGDQSPQPIFSDGSIPQTDYQRPEYSSDFMSKSLQGGSFANTQGPNVDSDALKNAQQKSNKYDEITYQTPGYATSGFEPQLNIHEESSKGNKNLKEDSTNSQIFKFVDQTNEKSGRDHFNQNQDQIPYTQRGQAQITLPPQTHYIDQTNVEPYDHRVTNNNPDNLRLNVNINDQSVPDYSKVQNEPIQYQSPESPAIIISQDNFSTLPQKKQSFTIKSETNENRYNFQENGSNVNENPSTVNYDSGRENKTVEKKPTSRFRNRFRESGHTRERVVGLNTQESREAAKNDFDKNNFSTVRKQTINPDTNQESEYNVFNEQSAIGDTTETTSQYHHSTKKHNLNRVRRPPRPTKVPITTVGTPSATKYLIRTRKPTMVTTKLQTGRHRIRRPTTPTTTTPTTTTSEPLRTLPDSWVHTNSKNIYSDNTNIRQNTDERFIYPDIYNNRPEEQLSNSNSNAEVVENYKTDSGYVNEESDWRVTTESNFHIPRKSETLKKRNRNNHINIHLEDSQLQQTTPSSVSSKEQFHSDITSLLHGLNAEPNYPYNDNYEQPQSHGQQSRGNKSNIGLKYEQGVANNDNIEPSRKTQINHHFPKSREQSRRIPNHSYDTLNENYEPTPKTRTSHISLKNTKSQYDFLEEPQNKDNKVQSVRPDHLSTQTSSNVYTRNRDIPDDIQSYQTTFSPVQNAFQTIAPTYPQDFEQSPKRERNHFHQTRYDATATPENENSTPSTKNVHYIQSSTKKPNDSWNQGVSIQQSESYVYMPEGYFPENSHVSQDETTRNNSQLDYDDYYNSQGSTQYTSDQSPFPSNERQVAYENLKETKILEKNNQYTEKPEREEPVEDSFYTEHNDKPDSGNQAPRIRQKPRPVAGETVVNEDKANKRRGTWVRVRVKRPKEFFETAESQSFGTSFENSVHNNSKSSDKISEVININKNKSNNFQSKEIEKTLKTHENNNLSELNKPSGNETNRVNEEKIIPGIQNGNGNYSETEAVTVPAEDNKEVESSQIFSISTATEISLETEICYKGRCVKTKSVPESQVVESS